MQRFLIGQYGSFDYAKYERDYRDGFYGIEACLLGREDVENLIKESRERKFHVGIHFPLRAGRSELRDALILSPDDQTRKHAYALIEQELTEHAEKVKPNHILFHYPKPVILDDRVDWTLWRFADTTEYVYESEYSIREFRERSESFFQWISAQGEAYGFTPVLEFDALNRYIYGTDLLESLLGQYPKVRLCLDTGRLYLQEKIDPYFDSHKIVKTYAKYAEIVHLCTLRFADRIENYKYPVLPEQDPQEGWAPIEQYLRIIKQENPAVKVLFEHRSDFISDSDLDRCYAWVEGLMR